MSGRNLVLRLTRLPQFVYSIDSIQSSLRSASHTIHRRVVLHCRKGRVKLMPPSRNLESCNTSSNSLLPISEHEASPLTCPQSRLKLLSYQHAMRPSLAGPCMACTSAREGLEFDDSANGIMAVSYGFDTMAST